MKIVADENMPGLEVLQGRAEVLRLPGRALTANDIAGADALLVRSVTRVDANLLDDSGVRFVGSATIGTDHIDLDWLTEQGIQFAHAPGCNARSVAEYVLQAVLDWCVSRGEAVQGKRIGIVGLGNVGTLVATLFQALGCDVLVSDPPREQAGEDGRGGESVWAPIDRVLGCDVVTLHVPFTAEGKHATTHMIGALQLVAMQAGQLLVNTCRGAVIDNQALSTRLGEPNPPTVVLDVWEAEPAVSEVLFRQVYLGTPHIAGYSTEGKLTGSAMVLSALYQWCGWSDLVVMPSAPAAVWSKPVHDDSTLLALLQGRYSAWQDHRSLAASLSQPDVGAAFDSLRRHYAGRHEMLGVQVRGSVSDVYRLILSRLGVDH